jgi:hypothetical protein
MIVWRGYGLLLMFVFLGVAWIVQEAFDPTHRNRAAEGLGCIVGGMLLGGVGLLLNRKANRPVSYDSIFYIPILWLGPLFMAYGLYRLIFR